MDKYRKLERIGKGSFGAAYLAEKKGDPVNKYVIKEIQIDPRDQQAAIREARLLGALDHPNIIASKESFMLPGNKIMCIVTEYADGGDLRQRLKHCIADGRRMTEETILDIFVQMCLALKHVHDRKILHRDIKPENVFLMQSNVVKLGDFGVAKVLSNTLACADTQTGTPYYTSPEICVGKRYNHKTDVWSLGCVLYEMITLTHAFNGPNQRQLFANIAHGAYDTAPLSCVSPRLSVLVQDMLKKQPRDRPSVNTILKRALIRDRIQSFLSAQEMRDELNHTVLHGQHIFRRKAPQPSSPRAMKQPPPPPIPQAYVRPMLARPVRGYAAPTAAVRQRQENLAQRKQAAARSAEAKLAQERKARLVAAANAKRLQDKKVRCRSSRTLIGPQDVGPKKPVAQDVASRVAIFNAQWERQKLDLFANLPVAAPKSAPVKGSAVVDFKQKLEEKKQKLLAAQEARDRRARAQDDTAVELGPKYVYPSERERLRLKMCDDIRAKKRLLKGKCALEDPVILVQALKPPPPPIDGSLDTMNVGGAATVATAADTGATTEAEKDAPATTPGPNVEVMIAPDTMHYGSTVGSMAGALSPRKPTLYVEIEPLDEEAAAAFRVEEVGADPVATAARRHNELEYERMVLQMKSIVEASVPLEDEDDSSSDDDEVLPPFEVPLRLRLPVATFEQASTLTAALLQDAAFKAQVRALLRGEAPSAANASALILAQFIREITL
ncbi:protein kinase [Achlya hypogyna]|uniref:non-specific serine/threonine protein kinase n=1 Tax=Achlya hypogyna TaxID=1202772 RepID=A0A1V9YKL0_ACHHY|nr:protein kinase [Achlya hypogyna]